MEFQRRWESRAYELGGSNYQAPGQLVGDFLAGKPSTKFGAVQPSYTPGVHLTDLSTALPDYAIAAIREALPAFAKQIKGFDLPDAVLTGVETRTSSPIRIKRNDDDLQSINTSGLYPAGEGAGYAGGILSAAVDGIKVAEAVALSTPNEAGISVAAIQHFAGKIPILGVCLGHQSIGQAFGGHIIHAKQLMHGKTSAIHHNNTSVFTGLPNPFTATRYHSLVIERETLPDCLEITAWTDDNEIMGVRHKTLAVHGVQFHPESILTEHGHDMLKNFLEGKK